MSSRSVPETINLTEESTTSDAAGDIVWACNLPLEWGAKELRLMIGSERIRTRTSTVACQQ